ncbi:unnamed protein product [Brachionus calyciflorus]|uniref:Reverse transcriptase domain-containing protein n=1 Tax=Brachionus calyciflorus TaxID=104777 RepID=A0A813NPE7_9BILA|nr:unnamed protein product [Brachionus calyciflorus]
MKFYSLIFSTGLVPSNLNVSIVITIPKGKNNWSEPGDFRPISVSSCFASILEHIILQNIDIRSKIHSNQFGYKDRTSCKHTYFMVNETIQFYNVNKSSVYMASLDAQKAFDKLWRFGLFFKLSKSIPNIFWIALFNYYKVSDIVIKFGGAKSVPFRINDGVKQGGFLSPYLFNFYINDLIQNCTDLKTGCRLGDFNSSIISYCDDIVLLSPTRSGLQSLLDKCSEYSKIWRINFNPKKSIGMCLKHRSGKESCNDFFFNESKISIADESIYLGLPIGSHKYLENYWNEKNKKVQKSLYSLNGIGCRAFGLEPFTLAKIYGIYSQPIFNYGLELCHIKKSKLKEYDRLQACLFKRNIGLSKYARNTALLASFRINPISKLYYKFKILFYYQIKNLSPVSGVLDFLKNHYKTSKCPDRSFIKQLKDTTKIIGKELEESNAKDCLEALDDAFLKKITFRDKDELFRKIRNLCHLISNDQDNCTYYKFILYKVLNEASS